MLLRASGQQQGYEYNLNSVTEADGESGVVHGDWLRQLTEAAIGGNWSALTEIRQQAAHTMGAQQVVDALTVAAAFNGITRVADATGIPLDDNTATATTSLREATGIQRFSYTEKSARYG